MKPSNFPEANSSLLGGPAEKYGTGDTVVDLPTYRDGEIVVSCWSLTLKERLAVLASGQVWLCVIGLTHAPVKLCAESPFGGRPKRSLWDRFADLFPGEPAPLNDNPEANYRAAKEPKT